MVSPEARVDARCWTAVLAPPVLWAVAFEARYVFSNPANRNADNAALHWITALTTVVTLVSAYCAWRWWRELPPSEEPTGETARFMLGSGVALALFFALVTLTDAIPALILSPTD
jgi:hypothetical protein